VRHQRPVAFTWTNAPFGSQVLTARATDDRLAATLSAPSQSVFSTASERRHYQPCDGAVLLAGVTNTSSPRPGSDGFITKVEFYAGATKRGQLSVPPYAFPWRADPGHYALWAAATDNEGVAAVSAPVNVLVAPAPGRT